MHLQQTTLFGVRGERIRIKKTSPIVKIAVGELMDFHSLIGGEVTSTGHTVTEVWPRPNNFGCDVARISGRSGWVATAALTRAEKTQNAQGKAGAGSGSAPVAAERAETMWWKCLDCGNKWRDLRECKGVCQSGCPACGSRNIFDCNLETSARGGAEGAEKDKCDGCLNVGVTNCLACIERDGQVVKCESSKVLKLEDQRERTPNAQRGEASGCGLAALLVLAAAIAAAALMVERRGVRVQVSWITEYPDPVCERCGKVLDGTHSECVEEGR